MILLFGMPRSGTTWVGKVFDSHSDVHYRQEPDSHLLLDKIMPLFAQTADTDNYAAALRDYCTTQLGVCSNKICGNGMAYPIDHVSTPAKWLQLGRINLNRNLERLTGRKRFWKAGVPALGQRLAWKSIESLGRLGVLLYVLPQNRAIIIMRNPCGHIASVLRGESRGKFSATRAADDFNLLRMLLDTEYGRNSGMTLNELKTMSEEQRLAWCWVLFYQKALNDTRGRGNWAAVRYEEIFRAPDKACKALFDFVELGRNTQTEQFVSATTTTDSDSYYTVYRDPLKAAMKWQSELSDEQIRSITNVIEQHPAGQAYYATVGSNTDYRFINC